MKRHLILAGLTLGLAACGAERIAAPRDGTAQLRLANASADAAQLDLRVDGQTLLAGVSNADVSDYADVDAGHRELAITLPGVAQPIILRSVTLEKDKLYTLLFTGSLASPNDFLTSDTASIPNPGKVKIRVFHAAPSAPPMDVYLTEYGADLASAFKLYEPFQPNADTAQFPGYVERDPGSWQVRFTEDNALNVLMDTGPIALTGGQVVTVVLFERSDSAGTGTLLGIRLIDETPYASPQAVYVRLVHAAPGAPPLDAHALAPGQTLNDPHWQFSPFVPGFDSVLFIPAYASSGPVDVTVLFTDHGTSNAVVTAGPISIPKGERRRVTLQNAQGGGLEAVVGTD